MPELPEVETVKNGLQELLPKRSVITDVFKSSKNLRFKYPAQLKVKIKGNKILTLSRRAKYLLFDLGDNVLLSHLGMTGTWRIEKAKTSKLHDHFSLQINNKFWLIYNDPRRFGYVDLIEKNKLPENKWFSHLGPEPLDRNVFQGDYLWGALKARKAPIKNAIMDQAVVVGVGNIYASESLYLAGIRPSKPCHRVTKAGFNKLTQGIQNVLSAAIKAGGTTISDFKQAGGSEGYFQQKLNVYGRGGQACVTCGSAIKQITQAGRSSYYCPKCQT